MSPRAVAKRARARVSSAWNFSFYPAFTVPVPTCHGARFNAKTLEVLYREKNIAEVLALTVDAAAEFFSENAQVARVLRVLQEVGLGYLRLGQPATELSGGEAQRVKLATELQRPTVATPCSFSMNPRLDSILQTWIACCANCRILLPAGNTVIIVEHDMQVIASSDWVIDMGPGAGDEGGKIVVAGPSSHDCEVHVEQDRSLPSAACMSPRSTSRSI